MNAASTAAGDERLARTTAVRRLLVRPEFAAVIGAVVVYLFFWWQAGSLFASTVGAANWLDPASTLGIGAVAVALLMVGGEFDLSAGVMTGSAGLLTGMLATKLDWNLWLAIAAALGFALLIGFLNGLAVVKTGLPSFIVTLGTLLALQGANLGVTKLVTGTVQVRGLADTAGYDSAHKLFASTIDVLGTRFQVSILWWLAVTAVASWVLLRTRAGNWIFSVGGAALAARSVGVPVARTKIALFMTTSAAAWLIGVISAVRFTSIQAGAGFGQEFEFIIAAVIGGCLLSGGYGTAVGAAIGALIYGMAKQGIVYSQWDNDWFKLFLGAMLLFATLANNLVRKWAEEARK
jgi:simple sugar transport system permease protein